MRTWWLLGLVVIAASACRCGESLESVEPGYTVTPEALDFGRVLEGRRATLVVTLNAQTRAAGTVTAVTSTPFSSAGSVALPGEAQLDLPVAFLAGDGQATGTLVLTLGRQSRTVTLRGIGVRPPTCTPGGSCLRSTYSLELDRCVETQAPDGTACDPGSLCLEQGQCKVGQCVGVQRRCDDNDACTLDGCSLSTGCVHTPARCPPPSNRCRQATCDSTTGCGEVAAPDGTLCGPVSCVSTALCATGECTTIDTPEGTPCGSAFACLPVGACRAKECTRPDAGDWRPAWSTELAGVPASRSPALLANQTAVFFPLCGVTFDAGGALDGGDDDGGRCGLYSWTSSGFDRFATPLGEGLQLVHVSARGVLLLGDGGLALHALNSGARLASVEVPASVDTVAWASDGAVLVVADGGQVLAWTDAGLQQVGALSEGGAVALDSAGGLFSWAGGGQLTHLRFVDAGTRLSTVALDAGERSLTVAGLTAVVGLGAAVTVDPEAGVLLTPLDQGNLVQSLLPRGVLQGADQVAFFTRRCPTPLVLCGDAERSHWVSMNDLRNGAQEWSLPVSGFVMGAEVRLVEPALFDLTGLSPTANLGVGALHEFSSGETSRLAFQVFGEGQRLLQCPLQARSPRARGAVFEGHQLFVLVEREDGGSALEAYDLRALPLYQGGWSAPGGAGGTRRSP